MKRYFVLLLFCIAVCSNAVYAQEKTDGYKKNFYDNLQRGMIESIQMSLTAQGMPADKVSQYVSALDKRIDRQMLENTTWACVSKYSDDELVSDKEKIAEECFSGWVTDLINQNTDLLEILK